MAIAKLSIDIEARLASLQAGLDKAGLLAESTANQISGAFGGLKSVAATVGPALASALAGASIAGFLRQTIDGIDALNDLSDATGASIENLSALEDAAARTGTQMDTVGSALVKLNQQLAAAKPGNETDQALRAIGLSAEELRRIDPAQALLQVAQSLQQFEDDGNKARLVQELFGKSVREVAPLLKDLAESGQLNATVTKAQADEADRFNKELARLSKNATDAGRAVVADLLPALNNFLEKFRGAREAAGGLGELFKQGAGQLLRGEIFSSGTEALDVYQGKVRDLTAELDKLRAGNTRSIYGGGVNDGPIRRVEAELQRVQQLADAYRKLYGAPDAGGGRGFVNPELPRPSLPEISATAKPARVAGLDRAPDTYADVIGRGVAALIEKTDTVKLAELNAQLAKLEELAAAGLDPKIVEQVRSLLIPIDKGDVGPPISAELEKINALLAQTDSAQLAEAQRTLVLLNDELSKVDAGSERFLQLQEAILAAQDRLTELAGTFPELKKQTDDIGKDIGLTFSSAFEDAVVQGKKFSDILKGIGDDLLRLLVRKSITEPIVGAIGGINWGSLLAGFLGSAKGNAFGPSGVIPFATGGIVNSPTLFGFAGGKTGVMGEAGTEGILPLKRGRDGKLGVIASGMGGGVVINQTINVAAGASRNEVLQAAATAKAAAVAEIQDLMRRGNMSLRGA